MIDLNVIWTAVGAVATCVTALIAACGVFFVTRQLKQVEQTIRGDVSERLTAGSIEILKLLVEKPESYPYLYGGKLLSQNDSKRVVILYIAEIVANYMENVINQLENMNEQDKKTWTRFVTDTCKMAPVVRDVLLEHKEWYSPKLVSIAEGIQKSGESSQQLDA